MSDKQVVAEQNKCMGERVGRVRDPRMERAMLFWICVLGILNNLALSQNQPQLLTVQSFF